MRKVYLGMFLFLSMQLLIACSGVDESGLDNYSKALKGSKVARYFEDGVKFEQIKIKTTPTGYKFYKYEIQANVKESYEELIDEKKYDTLISAFRTVLEVGRQFDCGKEDICTIDRISFIRNENSYVLSGEETFFLEHMKMTINGRPYEVPNMVGMTESEVRTALGEPDAILETESDIEGDKRYRWWYKNKGYLYFAYDEVQRVAFKD